MARVRRSQLTKASVVVAALACALTAAALAADTGTTTTAVGTPLARQLLPVTGEYQLRPTGAKTPAVVAANSTTFTDTTGEISGPDITTVVVSNDDSGFITIRVNVPNRPTLTGEQITDVFLDTDRNANTGSSGYDYVVEAYRGAFSLYRWNGSEFRNDSPRTTLSYSYAAGPTWRINAAELGNTRNFSFVVLHGDQPNVAAVTDAAPNPGTLWAFEVRISTPPPPPPTPPPSSNRVRITSYTQSSRLPTAGEGFEVEITVRRVGRPGVWNGTLHCQARAGSTLLRLYGSPRRGSGSCLWAIPNGAAGKRLTGFIGASESGGPVALRRFSLRIRAGGARLSVEGGVQTLPNAGPVSGQQFQLVAGVAVERGGSHHRIVNGTLQCNASIGSRRLQGKREIVSQAGIRCTWRIPPGTSGQTFKALVVVRSDGGTLRIPYSRRIR